MAEPFSAEAYNAEYGVRPGDIIVGNSPEHLRSRIILNDIYNWHGIPGHVPPQMAETMIAEQARQANLADDEGKPSTAWANPDERAEARLAYAEKGRTPEEKHRRWAESEYLMDPHRQKYWQDYGRHIDFLRAVSEAVSRPSPENSPPREISAPARRMYKAAGIEPDSVVPSEVLYGNALGAWDRSNGSPLHRKGIVGETYAGTGGFGRGVENFADGTALNALEHAPDTIRYATSADSQGAYDAGVGAKNNFHSRENYRLTTPAPILPDLPSSATAEQRAQRLRDLQEMTRLGEYDPAEVRIKRITGITPSAFARDAVSAVESVADGTQALPLLGWARPFAKAFRIAGGGWQSRMASNIGKDLAKDAGQDMAISGAIIGGAGAGATPNWNLRDYLLKPVDMPEQSADPRDKQEARAQLARMRQKEPGVSAADEEAYKKLMPQLDLTQGAPAYFP